MSSQDINPVMSTPHLQDTDVVGERKFVPSNSVLHFYCVRLRFSWGTTIRQNLEDWRTVCVVSRSADNRFVSSHRRFNTFSKGLRNNIERRKGSTTTQNARVVIRVEWEDWIFVCTVCEKRCKGDHTKGLRWTLRDFESEPQTERLQPRRCFLHPYGSPIKDPVSDSIGTRCPSSISVFININVTFHKTIIHTLMKLEKKGCGKGNSDFFSEKYMWRESDVYHVSIVFSVQGRKLEN